MVCDFVDIDVYLRIIGELFESFNVVKSQDFAIFVDRETFLQLIPVVKLMHVVSSRLGINRRHGSPLSSSLPLI